MTAPAPSDPSLLSAAPRRAAKRAAHPARLFAIALLTTLVAGVAGARGPLDVRLNEIQVIGSHNSYHVQPLPELIDIYVVVDPAAIAWEYTHRPLDEQFELLGIRQIELDVYADPAGGLHSEPLGLEILTGSAVHLPEFDPPGLKVIHVTDLDFGTTCALFVDCLQVLKTWSDANPEHLPIVVLVEVKDDPPPDLGLDFITPIPFGAAELDTVDAEIRSVFPEEQILTPDDVRGTRSSLEEAILKDGWPLLREVRGQVLFALDNGGSKLNTYVSGHPALAGRVMFTNSPVGSPEAAFLKLNDPIGSFETIRTRAEEGYLIRTRADSDTMEARSGDTNRRDIALASGAQLVSTDYPEPGPFGTAYQVQIPGGEVARCNPVIEPKKCSDAALENLTGEQPVVGKRLVVKDKLGKPEKRVIAFRAVDPLIETPLPGSADDPRTAGATVDVLNPGTGENFQVTLPGGPLWSGLGKPEGIDGYKYKDKAGANGPCRSLVVRRGKRLALQCVGRNGPISFSLDEASQQSLQVTWRIGAAPLYCAEFGGEIVRDDPAIAGAGAFIAKNAAAAGCPVSP